MMKTSLRPYQDAACDMVLDRHNALIAYEMGLGKTVVSLAIMEELLGTEEGFLNAIVVPANLKYQWLQEIARHTDVPSQTKTINSNGEKIEITIPTAEYAVVIDGSAAQREKQLRYVLEHRPDYVVLGYENVVNDWNLVRRIKPDLICLDEATAIKTFKAQRTKKIKRWNAEYRIALTGSPIENGKPEEIFSIMQWDDADVLGRFDLFDKAFITRNQFGGVLRYKNMPVLNAKLSTAMARKRRTDPDVAPFLPDVQEDTEWISIDKKTRDVYRLIGEDLLKALEIAAQKGMSDFDLFSHYHGGDSTSGSKEQGDIMARMQALEMLLCHPALIVESGKDYEHAQIQKAAGSQKKTWPGSKYCYDLWQSGALDGLKSSPKLDALISALDDLTGTPDNKIVVFSYYRRVGKFIAEVLADRGIKSTPYHGEMSPGEKVASVAKFREDPETRVIICSHAGAFGTDLNMANYLVNFDLPWSAGTMDQINARHVRVSSKFEKVFILNMVCANTLEARKPEVLAFKRRTAEAVVDGRGSDRRGRIEKDVDSLTAYLHKTL